MLQDPENTTSATKPVQIAQADPCCLLCCRVKSSMLVQNESDLCRHVPEDMLKIGLLLQ